MKKVLLSSFLLLFVTYGIASAGMFGPTEPTAQPGKFSLGVGYFYDQMKWEAEGLEGDSKSQSNMYYVQVSFTPIKAIEIFGRLGGADAKDTDPTDPTWTFRDSVKPFGSLGVKAIFYQDQMFSFGAFALGTYLFQDFKDSFTGTIAVPGVGVVPVTIERTIKDYYSIQAGLSAQWKVQDFIIYGGGFWYYARAKSEGTASALGISVVVPGFTSKEKTPVGGFLGIRIPFTKAASLSLEGQYRDELSGGAFLSYAF